MTSALPDRLFCLRPAPHIVKPATFKFIPSYLRLLTSTLFGTKPSSSISFSWRAFLLLDRLRKHSMSVIKTPTKVSTVPTIVPISAALFKPPPLVDVGAVEPVADEDCVDDAVPVSEGRVAV